MPFTTSSACDGPESATTRGVPNASAAISVMRRCVFGQNPFVRLTTTAVSGKCARNERQTSSKWRDGTATTTISASRSASAGSCVHTMDAGRPTPGR